VQNRGGLGVTNIQTSSRNGRVVAAKAVADDHELLLITQRGIVIRTKASEISSIGRNTQGVRVMKLREGDSLQACARVMVEQSE
jgi:DNA gyrase subunit A